MKKIIYILSSLFLIAGFIACDQDTTGTKFDFGGKDYYTFRTKTTTINASESGKASVNLYHLNSSVSSSVDITVEYDEAAEGLFTVTSSTVSFTTDTEPSAIEITYNVEDLEFNVEYHILISVPEQTYGPKSDVQTIDVKIINPPTFNELGTGLFTSEFFEDEWEQVVLWANEVPIYQLPDLFEPGYNINLLLNEDNTVTVDPQPAWNYNANYGDVYVVGEGVKEGNVITLTLEHVVWSIEYSFGAFEEILVLPETE
ncbi:MAG: hypothetical protein LBS25_07820 [Candidatus Symbiothrix sp.]|nr:hypothetical protein [Candidatus Symbiothrix sp.]